MSHDDKLWSLLDMLDQKAELFVRVGEAMEHYLEESPYMRGDILPHAVDLVKLLEFCVSMKDYSAGLHLSVTTKLMEKSLESFRVVAPTNETSRNELNCWYNCFKAELESIVLQQVLPHRVPYMSRGQSVGDEIKKLTDGLLPFAGSIYDAQEAGNCFAYERFTACVHHLSKCVEYGLAGLASYAGVEQKDQRNWNKALNICQEYLRERKQGFKDVAPRSKDEAYFSEAIGLLRNFKTAWRNPSSHAKGIFSEDKAQALFVIAATTMQHLSQRLVEVPMTEIE